MEHAIPFAGHYVRWNGLPPQGHHGVPRENRWSCLQVTLRSPLVAVWDPRYPVPGEPKATPESPLGLLVAYLSQGERERGYLW